MPIVLLGVDTLRFFGVDGDLEVHRVDTVTPIAHRLAACVQFVDLDANPAGLLARLHIPVALAHPVGRPVAGFFERSTSMVSLTPETRSVTLYFISSSYPCIAGGAVSTQHSLT